MSIELKLLLQSEDSNCIFPVLLLPFLLLLPKRIDKLFLMMLETSYDLFGLFELGCQFINFLRASLLLLLLAVLQKFSKLLIHLQIGWVLN